MAISLQQDVILNLYGDGAASVFSYDLSKAPVSSGSSNEIALSIGTPSSVVPQLIWQSSPQIGLDVNSNPIYDQPSATCGLTGTTLTITFGAPPKLFGSVFTDGQNNQWNISIYSVQITFVYNSLG
jgi:hypothetical protein